ncbi:MAG: phage integrase N-terminal SAM-like domain-containing protein [Balneolaceae bacterium]|nr:phage integrase N-terminal SAM-like domain-containing protein [Balneolaceae bacterium]
MRKSLMLSNLRVELRRKQSSFSTERMMINWVKKFFEEMSIVHSSQIRDWQKEMFLSDLRKKEEISYDDLLQAKSSILFLFEKVLKQADLSKSVAENEPGAFRITA